MQDSHAVVPKKAPARQSSFNGSPYENGFFVLQDSAFVSKKGFTLESKSRIWSGAVGMGILVFLFALGLQWTIYDRFLHENGIRVVGSGIAAVIAIGVVVVLGMASRRQRLQEIERLQTIALLNHHIRNALQAIVTCSGASNSTDTIRHSVERIEWALGEVLPGISKVPAKQS